MQLAESLESKLDDLRADNERLHEALRANVITDPTETDEDGEYVRYCALCNSDWVVDGAYENHTPGCLAAKKGGGK